MLHVGMVRNQETVTYIRISNVKASSKMARMSGKQGAKMPAARQSPILTGLELKYNQMDSRTL